MKLIDANIIIRFLLKDHSTQSPAAKKLLSNYQEDLLLTDVAVAEIIWVLASYYKLSKKEIIEKIYPILNMPNINCNKSVLIRALYFYRNLNIDYIDAYLAAYAEQNKLPRVFNHRYSRPSGSKSLFAASLHPWTKSPRFSGSSNKLEGIYSFDKDLDKIKSVKRIKI